MINKELKEIWKPCPEYERHYEISNLGNLRSKRVFIPNDSIFGEIKGVWKKQQIKNQTNNRDGYKTSKLCKEGKCRRLTIHRLVAKAFLENPNGYSQVNHIDGNKENNRVDNLEWCSPSANIKHAYETGLMKKDHLIGENHVAAKLTWEEVRSIRKRLKAGEKGAKLAEEYGVSPTTITYIKQNKIWIE